MSRTIADLLYEAEQSLENMGKPSYNKKAWHNNFCLCMDALLKRGDEMKNGHVKKFNKLLEHWK